MALVLSLKEGDDLWVDNTQIVLSEIKDGSSFYLKVAGEPKAKEITELKALEILPEVMVSAGGFFKYGMVRVVLDAPRDIEILRGDRYRAKYQSGQHNDGVS